MRSDLIAHEITWSDYRGCYVGKVPTMPSIEETGASIEEVMKKLEAAKIKWATPTTEDKGLEPEDRVIPIFDGAAAMVKVHNTPVELSGNLGLLVSPRNPNGFGASLIVSGLATVAIGIPTTELGRLIGHLEDAARQLREHGHKIEE